MPSNLKIDDRLLQEALQLGGLASKRETVDQALREFVSRRRKREILKFEGTVDFDPSYDPEEQRKIA